MDGCIDSDRVVSFHQETTQSVRQEEGGIF